MIDAGERRKRLLREAANPEVAVNLLDLIVGYNRSQDPVGELSPAIVTAQQNAEIRGSEITFVASLTGTEQEPQGDAAQRQALEQTGVFAFNSNAAAANYCLRILRG